MDYFRQWAMRYLSDFAYHSRFSAVLDNYSTVGGATAREVEATAAAYLVEAPDEVLLDGRNKSMVSTMLFPRSNIIGALEEHLESVKQLRSLILAEMGARWPEKVTAPAAPPQVGETPPVGS